MAVNRGSPGASRGQKPTWLVKQRQTAWLQKHAFAAIRNANFGEADGSQCLGRCRGAAEQS